MSNGNIDVSQLMAPPVTDVTQLEKVCTENSVYDTTRHDTTRHDTTRYNTIQYNTIQYNTIQYNTIQYNTIQYNTIQYNTLTLVSPQMGNFCSLLGIPITRVRLAMVTIINFFICFSSFCSFYVLYLVIENIEWTKWGKTDEEISAVVLHSPPILSRSLLTQSSHRILSLPYFLFPSTFWAPDLIYGINSI